MSEQRYIVEVWEGEKQAGYLHGDFSGDGWVCYGRAAWIFNSAEEAEKAIEEIHAAPQEHDEYLIYKRLVVVPILDKE